ncbi:MAG TPA: hypothetical protein VD837_14400 [Terriglobales bacterium]|nr:hypothetical protein [Terriglobales bacterium]
MKKIKKMTDAELDGQASAAWNIAFGETFCDDYEAYWKARQTYYLLAREQMRRKRL